MSDCKTIETRAVELITASYEAHGLCELTCDSCGHGAMAINSATASDPYSVDLAVQLLGHARYEHATPRNILAVVHTRVFNTEEI